MIGAGSIPATVLMPAVLAVILVRYLSVRLLETNQNLSVEVPMVETSLSRSVHVFSSAACETAWAAGVSGVVGLLLA